VIEVKHGIKTDAILKWLEYFVVGSLRPDVSNYAKGRLRTWIRTEPPLSPKAKERPGEIDITDKLWTRLEDIIEWKFDYCLVTYSGSVKAIGITPHRDSSFAAYEAMGLNVSGTCKFRYWNERNGFDAVKPTNSFPPNEPASHVFDLVPGDLVRFNCKNVHSAEPSIDRWNMNFWKKK
jgi:hypothetical protein